MEVSNDFKAAAVEITTTVVGSVVGSAGASLVTGSRPLETLIIGLLGGGAYLLAQRIRRLHAAKMPLPNPGRSRVTPSP